MNSESQVGRSEEPGQPRAQNSIWQLPLSSSSENSAMFIHHLICFCANNKSYCQYCATSTWTYVVSVLSHTNHHVVCCMGRQCKHFHFHLIQHISSLSFFLFVWFCFSRFHATTAWCTSTATKVLCGTPWWVAESKLLGSRRWKGTWCSEEVSSF